MNKQMIVKRESHEETTFAVIEFAGCSVEQLLPNLQAALKEWGKTPAGKEASDFTSGDFNVGDLANYTPAGLGLTADAELGECLVKHGITFLDIDVYSSELKVDWDFDTVLM